MIKPQEVIQTYSVEELSKTADDYFKSLADTTHSMGKPFSEMLETPSLLEALGVLLRGLQLSKTMVVLEFAAGTCWLSRYLNQLQCQTISCDVSQAALGIGKRLFEEYPIVGEPIAEPRFLHFDGHKIDLPDESVDRIICNDGFHHVPNQETVIAELARVLKTGGIAGFSEPGRFHSQSPKSQFDMRNFQVLENDIVLPDIFAYARKHGFTDCKAIAVSNVDFTLQDWQALDAKHSRLQIAGAFVKSLLSGTSHTKLLARATSELVNDINRRSIFFLYKGEPIPDSRSHHGLAHTISIEDSTIDAKAGETIHTPITVTNSGNAIWLTQNMRHIGIVNIGTHLYDQNETMLNIDFSRHPLPHTISPGQTFTQTLEHTFPEPGTYKLAIDLVAEQVSWFENVGSQPHLININVT